MKPNVNVQNTKIRKVARVYEDGYQTQITDGGHRSISLDLIRLQASVTDGVVAITSYIANRVRLLALNPLKCCSYT